LRAVGELQKVMDRLTAGKREYIRVNSESVSSIT
jgi:hypothetical protein